MWFRRQPDEGQKSKSFSSYFTDRVRRALARAREEAIALGHGYVGTEHILLGLTREEEGVSAAVLANLGATADQIRARVSESVQPGTSSITVGELPYTSRAKKVLAFAMDEARELKHHHVGTEHLLLGLLREETGIAAEVLGRLGITLHRARAETLRLLGAESSPGDQFRVRIDDSSDLPIYEQIVVQIQEGVATGALRPGKRLPTVRQLADRLEIAPGTVARAYAELERRGVVVTEGARGTRVADRREEALPETERPQVLAGLLRPVAVAAFHLGATAQELRDALDAAMRDIFK